MEDTCKYCHSTSAVPVLDKRIEKSPKPGNKYRSACLNCERWLPLASEAEFRGHPRPHVLPADAGSDEVDRLIPLEEYDYGDEWADLVQQETDQQAQQAIADGGEEPDRDDGDGDETINRFECPATGCTRTNEGKPASCPGCGAVYQW